MFNCALPLGKIRLGYTMLKFSNEATQIFRNSSRLSTNRVNGLAVACLPNLFYTKIHGSALVLVQDAHAFNSKNFFPLADACRAMSLGVRETRLSSRKNSKRDFGPVDHLVDFPWVGARFGNLMSELEIRFPAADLGSRGSRESQEKHS